MCTDYDFIDTVVVRREREQLPVAATGIANLNHTMTLRRPARLRANFPRARQASLCTDWYYPSAALIFDEWA